MVADIERNAGLGRELMSVDRMLEQEPGAMSARGDSVG